MGFARGNAPADHAAAIRALDAEVESLSDRLKNLEGR